jgi:hypothetical protein
MGHFRQRRRCLPSASSLFLNWLTNVTNDPIVQGASPGASYAVHARKPNAKSEFLYFGLCVLVPRRRKETIDAQGL